MPGARFFHFDPQNTLAEALPGRDHAQLHALGRHDGRCLYHHGNLFNENRIDAQPKPNTTEIWRFTNQSMMDHPIHMRGVMFQILDINGSPPPATHAGWKDVVVVPRMVGTARVIAKLTDYTGKYVFHCHVIEHEDMAMMANFQVIP